MKNPVAFTDPTGLESPAANWLFEQAGKFLNFAKDVGSEKAAEAWQQGNPIGYAFNKALQGTATVLDWVVPSDQGELEDLVALGASAPLGAGSDSIGNMAGYVAGKLGLKKLSARLFSSGLPRPTTEEKPASAETLPEAAGKGAISTRPTGIPETWSSKPSDNGGTIWFDPKSPSGNWVRIEQGKPSSPNPWQQSPYVKMFKDGKQVDVNGIAIPRPVRPDGTLGKSGDTQAAHIPLADFKGF